MPASIKKVGKKFQVKTPNGVKAKGTTKPKAKAQQRLLSAIDHGWKPDQTPAPGKPRPKKVNPTTAALLDPVG